MFRRNLKNPLEGNGSLFHEEPTPVTPYKYGTKKTDLGEPPSRLFDASYTIREERLPLSEIPPSPSVPLVEEDTPETTLGEGVSFRGELCFQRHLRIDGTFEGTLVSSGKVVVGPKGHVKAHLNLESAVIEGVVEGNITVKKTLRLQGNACIRGDIQAGALCVDEGVQIAGYVLITPSTPEPE